MNKNELTKYADYLLQTALYKVQSITDAEDLVQETLLSALVAIEQGKPIDNPKNWLVTVLNRKYYDMLRHKYRKPTVSIDIAAEIPLDDEAFQRLEQSEDAENIRRCLAYLTKLYREVMVRFYMRGESVKHIAAALGIPENTVKSRLDTGRKHIRKDFTMENYTKQSYEPETLWLCNSGLGGMNGEPFSLVGDDRIAMNILILAYEKPLTVTDIAKAIGIAAAYVEPIVDRLVDGELMKRTADKIYTDFIIYDEYDRSSGQELEESLAKEHYKAIWEIVQSGLDELHEQEFYKTLSSSQAIKLDSFFAVRTVQNAVNDVRNEACGGAEPFDSYPERPNDGKWYAMANRYAADYVFGKYNHFCISGESTNSENSYKGAKRVTLCEYDCTLGLTHQGYDSLKHMKHRMKGYNVMKILYAINTGHEDDMPLIDVHCDFDGLCGLGYMKHENRKIKVDIPIIAMNDRWELYKLSEKYDNIISEKYHDELMKLMQNPVKLPAHLKFVPNWQRYMWCCSTFPMRVIMNAHENGLFLAGRDLKENPVPAVFLAVAK